jgi:hypothetical protein
MAVTKIPGMVWKGSKINMSDVSFEGNIFLYGREPNYNLLTNEIDSLVLRY